MESRIFPRADALAERLWSNPKGRRGKWQRAEERLMQQRWRLTHRGVNAEALQPEWCRINPGQCYWRDYGPNEMAVDAGDEDDDEDDDDDDDDYDEDDEDDDDDKRDDSDDLFQFPDNDGFAQYGEDESYDDSYPIFSRY